MSFISLSSVVITEVVLYEVGPYEVKISVNVINWECCHGRSFFLSGLSWLSETVFSKRGTRRNGPRSEREGCVTTEIETGVIWPWVRKHKQPPQVADQTFPWFPPYPRSTACLDFWLQWNWFQTSVRKQIPVVLSHPVCSSLWCSVRAASEQ